MLRSPSYSRSFAFLWFSITIISNSGQNTNTNILVKKISPNKSVQLNPVKHKNKQGLSWAKLRLALFRFVLIL